MYLSTKQRFLPIYYNSPTFSIPPTPHPSIFIERENQKGHELATGKVKRSMDHPHSIISHHPSRQPSIYQHHPIHLPSIQTSRSRSPSSQIRLLIEQID